MTRQFFCRCGEFVKAATKTAAGNFVRPISISGCNPRINQVFRLVVRDHRGFQSSRSQNLRASYKQGGLTCTQEAANQ
jgi:hypothetical protein